MDEYEAFRQRAAAAGYSPEEIEADIAKQKATTANPLKKEGLKNLGRSAAQGVSFGFADEIVGKLPEWLGGGEAARDEMRAKNDAFKAEHPFISAGAELAGGLAVPGLGAVKTLGTGVKTIRGAMGAGAAVGGVSGGLYGAGSAEGDVADRLKAAGPAAVLGAAGGALIPGAAAGLKSLKPSTRADTRLRVGIARSGGEDKLLKTLEEFKAAGRGNDVMFGDLSVPLRQTTDYAVNASDNAAEMVGGKAYGRHADAGPRILDDVRSVVGDPDAAKITDELKTSTAKWANSLEGFQGLRADNPTIPPEAVSGFGAILESPAVNKAWQQAEAVGLIGPKPKAGAFSFEVLQDTKEMLDDATDAAFNSGRGGLGDRLKTARDELVVQMRQHIPEYEKVAAEYGRRKGMERLVKEGQEAFTQHDPRGLAKRVSQLDTDQLTKFRQGIGSEMIAKVRNTSTNRDLAKALTDASPALKDKLKVVFGSEKAAADFMEKMRIEREMSKILATLTGSQTAKRLAAQQGIDPLELALDIGTIPAAPWSGMSRLAGLFRGATKNKIAGSTATQLGPKVSTQGATAIEELLKQMRKKPHLVGRGAALSSGRIGQGAGLLFDQ